MEHDREAIRPIYEALSLASSHLAEAAASLAASAVPTVGLPLAGVLPESLIGAPPGRASPIAAVPPARADPIAAAPPARADPIAAAPPARADPIAAAPPARADPIAAAPPARADPIAAAPPARADPIAAAPLTFPPAGTQMATLLSGHAVVVARSAPVVAAALLTIAQALGQ